MKLARYKNILALKTDDKIIGFHSGNLQVAELDASAWAAISEKSLDSLAAQAELEQWNQEQDPETQDQTGPKGVRSLIVNIAQYCNLRCTYCAAGGDGTYGAKGKIELEKIQAQLSQMLKQVPDNGYFNLQFFGGEPLLHPEAIKSLASFAQLSVAGRNIALQFSITTNGTLITKENAELLAALNTHVTISIDGPAWINDLVRPSAGGKGSTARVLSGIERLMSVRTRLGSIGINSVFGKHNLHLVEAYEFFQPFDFDFLNFIYAVDQEDEIHSNHFVDEMKRVAEMAWNHDGEKELRKITTFDHYYNVLDDKVRTLNHCGAGKSLLYTDTRAEVYGCNWFMGETSEVLGRGLNMYQEKLQEYADPLIDRHGCHSCWARFLCGGGCMYVNKVKMNDKHKKDLDYCQRTRGLAALALKYYAEDRMTLLPDNQFL